MAMRPRAGKLLVAGLLALLAGAAAAGQDSPGTGTRAGTGTTPPEPRAPREQKELTAHGHTRQDPFYWMRDRDDPRVRAHLEAENGYFEARTARLRPLRDELVAELRKRQPVDLPLAPFEQAGSRIEGRFEPGKEYPVYVRRQRTEGGWGPEEVLLDVNEVAAGHVYCRVRLEGLDPSGRILAYIADTKGSGRYRLHFVDLESGEALPETIDGVVGGAVFGTTVFPAAVFSADSRFVFYARQVPGDMRLDSIWRHRLGTDPAEDVPVYREEDPRYWSLVTRSRAGDLILLYAISTEGTEVRVIPTDRPEAAPRLLFSREEGYEYWVDSRGGDELIVRTNRGAPGFRVVRAPRADPAPEHWREIRPGREGVLVDAMDLLEDHVVVLERRNARPELWVVPIEGGEPREIPFAEEARQVRFALRHRLESDRVRFEYSSLTTPRRLVAYDLETGEREVEAELQLLEGYDPRDYVSERLWAPARDGTRIPVSLVSRRDRPDRRDGRDGEAGGPAPVVLFGYGTYGVTIDPAFDATRLGLLERGFVYAIAHVRGGQALGREWYEQGRGLQKIHTFQDFVDVGRFLVESGRTFPDRLFARGKSAGGATVGASLNMAPDLFRGAVLEVPALDIITSMSDPTIPLVTGEYGEWGNPERREDYTSMLEWSPYDNLRAADYPRVLVLAGFHDRQVMYWEPAKWVAKLRAVKTDDHPVLLRIDMESGHQGASGRSRRLEDEALVQAFLIDLLPEPEGGSGSPGRGTRPATGGGEDDLTVEPARTVPPG